MSGFSHAKDRAVLGLVIGTAISTSFYIFKNYETQVAKGWLGIVLPFVVLSFVPQIPWLLYLATAGVVHWSAQALAFCYWPALGTMVCKSKRWAVWGILVVAVHFVVGVPAFFYFLRWYSFE
ncbi:MAG TPA: hypothetical protein VFC63_07060 [Blastocatellia bacterium]|nr:hypothetical protein [Blastocatellia bacterium]